MDRKPILCMDFDGVLHSYKSGWQGPAIIPDPPVPGAIEFLHGAIEHFRVAIFSSRSCQPGGIDAMRGWLTAFVHLEIDSKAECERLMTVLEWPVEKPPALVTIDDRAVTFTGQWPSLDDLKAFRPWNKPAPPPSGPAPFTTQTVSTGPNSYGGSAVRAGYD